MGAPATPWREVTNEEGKTYYHNTVLNTTTWTKPADLYDDFDVRASNSICTAINTNM